MSVLSSPLTAARVKVEALQRLREVMRMLEESCMSPRILSRSDVEKETKGNCGTPMPQRLREL